MPITTVKERRIKKGKTEGGIVVYGSGGRSVGRKEGRKERQAACQSSLVLGLER